MNSVKNLFYKISILAIVSMAFSCEENIKNCPSKMCVLSGGWKLTEAYVDGIKDHQDLSHYRLTLVQPEPATNLSSSFYRTQPSGNEDVGSWSLANNDRILLLLPMNDGNLKEEWIIESFSPRKLILIVNRDTDIKQGPSTIRFVLEPF